MKVSLIFISLWCDHLNDRAPLKSLQSKVVLVHLAYVRSNINTLAIVLYKTFSYIGYTMYYSYDYIYYNYL